MREKYRLCCDHFEKSEKKNFLVSFCYLYNSEFYPSITMYNLPFHTENCKSKLRRQKSEYRYTVHIALFLSLLTQPINTYDANTAPDW